MLSPLLITALAAGGIVGAWVAIGATGPVFASVTQAFLLVWAALAFPQGWRVPDRAWWRVREWEPRLYTALGVRAFGRVLDVVRWNRVITAERGFDGTRRGLVTLDQHTRRSEIGHSAGMLISVGLAIAAVVWGSWVGALWLVGLAIPVHLYPAWLQRLVRARIQVLRQRIAP